uniref:Cgd8_3650 protein n=3 Tax=Cryptosporidium parvum TaxID=5807 RepID=F0X4K9_CRYPV
MTSGTNEVLSLKVMSLSHSPIDSQVSTLSLLPCNLENGEEEVLCVDNMFPLLLPTTQCRLYCGESFHAFISITNSSIIKANGVVLKVELVGTKKRHILYNNEDNYSDIDIGDSLDIVVKERVDEVGLYSLTCQLFFTSNEARLTQKKSYKFAVLSPFNISHRLYNLDEDTMDKKTIFVEVSLENVSHQSITLSSMKLEPINIKKLPELIFELEDVNLKNKHNEPLYIQPRCKYNKIFKFTSCSREYNNLGKSSREVLELKLRIGWVSVSYGDGWLDSYKIGLPILCDQNKLNKEKNAIILKAELPSVNNRQEEFKVFLYVTNNLSIDQKGMSIRLDFDQLLPIIILGNDRLYLEELKAGETVTLELDCQALVSGVYNLNGIYVFDELEDKKVSV